VPNEPDQNEQDEPPTMDELYQQLRLRFEHDALPDMRQQILEEAKATMTAPFKDKDGEIDDLKERLLLAEEEIQRLVTERDDNIRELEETLGL
jgi:hypothetical protein